MNGMEYSKRNNNKNKRNTNIIESYNCIYLFIFILSSTIYETGQFTNNLITIHETRNEMRWPTTQSPEFGLSLCHVTFFPDNSPRLLVTWFKDFCLILWSPLLQCTGSRPSFHRLLENNLFLFLVLNLVFVPISKLDFVI